MNTWTLLSDRWNAVPGRLRTALCVLLVGVLACINFVVGRDQPPHPFWDETYYLTASQRYLDGTDQFASHPPLGLMLIASGEALIRANAGIDTHFVGREKQISGDDLPKNFSFKGLRLVPCLFAAGGALVFFGLMLSLLGRRDAALAFSTLYLFENGFMVHFTAMHLDGFQLFFVLIALWCAVAVVQSDQAHDDGLDAGFGLAVGLATMVKANAVLLLGMGVWYVVRRAWRHACVATGATSCPPRWRGFAAGVLRGGAWMAAPFALAIIGTYGVHAALIRHAPDSTSEGGRKDLSYMSPAHLAYAKGERGLGPEVLFEVVRDYQTFISADFKGIPKADRNSSIPLLWPVHDRSINYRWDSADGVTRYVQLVGNLFSWWLGLGALVLCCALWLGRRVLRMESRGSALGSGLAFCPTVGSALGSGLAFCPTVVRAEGEEELGGQKARPDPRDGPQDFALIEMFLAMYMLHMVVHCWMGTQRVMYLYHYFIALTLTYLMLPLMWRHLCDIYAARPVVRALSAAGIALGVLLCCAFFAPLSNHWPLNKAECERRNLFFPIAPCQ